MQKIYPKACLLFSIGILYIMNELSIYYIHEKKQNHNIFWLR